MTAEEFYARKIVGPNPGYRPGHITVIMLMEEYADQKQNQELSDLRAELAAEKDKNEKLSEQVKLMNHSIDAQLDAAIDERDKLKAENEKLRDDLAEEKAVHKATGDLSAERSLTNFDLHVALDMEREKNTKLVEALTEAMNYLKNGPLESDVDFGYQIEAILIHCGV